MHACIAEQRAPPPAGCCQWRPFTQPDALSRRRFWKPSTHRQPPTHSDDPLDHLGSISAASRRPIGTCGTGVTGRSACATRARRSVGRDLGWASTPSPLTYSHTPATTHLSTGATADPPTSHERRRHPRARLVKRETAGRHGPPRRDRAGVRRCLLGAGGAGASCQPRGQLASGPPDAGGPNRVPGTWGRWV